MHFNCNNNFNWISVAFALLFAFGTFHAINGQRGDVIINAKVDRVIDISSQLVTITSRIVIENQGKSPLTSYLLTFDDNHRDHLSIVSAIIDGKKQELPVTKVDDANWKIDFTSHPIAAGGTSPTIEVEAVFTHLLSPHPTHILQAERQLVIYDGNHYFLSPYATRTQTTKVKLAASGSVESFTKLKPTTQNDHTINYGPYENVETHAVSKMQIHSENNSPFLTVKRLERTIEVSHWAAMISVEEVIDIRHTGAELKGPFSRYEFQREPTNGISAVKSFKTKLPPTARDIYYRDEIGNISTSNVKVMTNNIVAELRPRFPLFGGWKTHYVLGYYVPSQDYLFSEGSQFVLKIPFVDHIFDNFVINEALVKVILPEGASDIKLRLPYSVIRERDQIHYTYLDTIGRTVLVLRKTNLVEQHIENFEVQYKYNRLYMLQEPLLVVAALFLLCILVIIYVRLDFSLTKNPLKQSAMKVSAVVETILKHHDKRSTIYTEYDHAATKFKSNKDNNAYQATLKRLNGEHKQEAQTISDLITKLKQEGASAEIVEKVNSLQSLDRTLKEQLTQQSALIEKLVAGKINKQLYMDTDTTIIKKKEEIADKMSAITNSL